jgi:hypothetical protein
VRAQHPVFIGPVCVGKSSVSTIVAELLGVPRIELDEIADAYYRAAPGFVPAEHERRWQEEGVVAAYRYWEPALVYAVERVVAEHPGTVLDLGAGHSCYLDRSLLPHVQGALASYEHVVLLLPDPDPDVSIRVIKERMAADRDGWSWTHDGIDFIHHWVTDEQNRLLADHVVFTGTDTPAAVAERVVALLRPA